MKLGFLRGSLVLLMAAAIVPCASVRAQSAGVVRTPARVVVLRPWGFEPARTSVPAGAFILAVYNRSGLREMWLRVDSGGPVKLVDLRVPREVLDFRKRLIVVPGTYTLTDVNHPAWTCSITVTA